MCGFTFDANDTRQKIDVIKRTLETRCTMIVWDNFELSYAFEDSNKILIDFVSEMQGGDSKVMVISTMAIPKFEEGALRLKGLIGDELVEYIRLVSSENGNIANWADGEIRNMLEGLSGNPLMICQIMTKFSDKASTQLLSEISGLLKRGENNDILKQIEQIRYCNLTEIKDSFDTVLRLIGLHEAYVCEDYIKDMLLYNGYSTDNVKGCFKALMRSGMCVHQDQSYELGVSGLYKLHPSISPLLKKQYPAAKNDILSFARSMAMLSEENSQMEMDGRNTIFVQYMPNFRNALDMSKSDGMDDCAVALMTGIANYEYTRKRYDEASELHLQIIDILSRANMRDHTGASFHMLGVCAEESGKFDIAQKYYENSIKIFAEFNDKKGLSVTYFQMGNLENQRNNLEKALLMYQKSLDCIKENGDKYRKAMVLYHVGMIYAKQERYDESIRILDDHLSMIDDLGEEEYQYRKAGGFALKGSVLSELGCFDDSISNLKSALFIYRSFADTKGIVDVYQRMAMTYIRISDLDSAEKCLNNAASLVDGSNNFELAFIYVQISFARLFAKDISSVGRLVREAMSLVGNLTEAQPSDLGIHKFLLESLPILLENLEDMSNLDYMSNDELFDYLMDLIENHDGKDTEELHELYKAAVFWFEKSAGQNHAPSQRMLGYFFINGLGAKKSIKEGLAWLNRASMQGDTKAKMIIMSTEGGRSLSINDIKR